MKHSYSNYVLTLVILAVASCSCVFAQEQGNVIYQGAGPGPGPGPVAIQGPVIAGAIGFGTFEKGAATPVQGAPYSANVTNKSTQTLADGNHIVQTTTGTIARDGLGRTRQDAPLPPIGNLSATDAPHIVFLRDPVSQTSYTLDLTDKTAQKMPALPKFPGPPGGPAAGDAIFSMRVTGGPVGASTDAQMTAPLPPPMPPAMPSNMPPPPPMAVFIQKGKGAGQPIQPTTVDLGSQTMEGLLVTGTRTTITIPAGQIGNEKPIDVVTEVWTSPDLKTVIYSKRTDPRMGEQIFQLTNVVRNEPDPSLFTVPSDFKVVDGPQPILYRTTQ
jgi:hypothetical protein